MTKKVLVTGMSGLIGGLLKDHLIQAGSYELSALNRSHVEGVTNFQADISDLEAIQPAFEGQDVVVHLAAYLGSQDWEGQHAGNVLGTYNVFEAARRAGVKRVIFASSGNAIRGFERVSPYLEISEGKFEQTDATKMPKEVMNVVGIGFRKTDSDFKAKFNEALAKVKGGEKWMSSTAEYGYTAAQLPPEGFTTEHACANK